ncbi:MAG: SRPBCC domain-containing protein [Pricia sp.]
MKTPDNTAERTLSITKTLKAPLEKVWAAWTDPEHVAAWWAPKDTPVTIVKHDFKVGGQWRYTMEMPDGNTFVSDGTYADIVPNTKLVTSADFRPMTVGVVLQVSLEENGKNTQLDFNVLHPTVAYCKQQEGMGFYKGWDAAFNRLEGYLSK